MPQFLAWDFPKKAVRMFFSVWVPFELFKFSHSEGVLSLGIGKRIGRKDASYRGGRNGWLGYIPLSHMPIR